MVGPASSDWLQNWERLTTERDVVSLFRIGLLMRESAFTLLVWLVIILNNAQQLFDFLGTAQHSALRARLHRGHAGHGWGDMSFISWWSSSFALGSRCCQRRLKERNKAECGRMWKAVFWISLIGQLVYKRRHDNVCGCTGSVKEWMLVDMNQNVIFCNAPFWCDLMERGAWGHDRISA